MFFAVPSVEVRGYLERVFVNTQFLTDVQTLIDFVRNKEILPKATAEGTFDLKSKCINRSRNVLPPTFPVTKGVVVV
jgi:hypothetical protein